MITQDVVDFVQRVGTVATLPAIADRQGFPSVGIKKREAPGGGQALADCFGKLNRTDDSRDCRQQSSLYEMAAVQADFAQRFYKRTG